MTKFSEYVSVLEQITLQDIKNIIDEDLVNNNNSVYGFRNEEGIIFWGGASIWYDTKVVYFNA